MRKYLSFTGVAICGIALIISSCVGTDYTPPDYDALLEADLAAVDQAKLTTDLARLDDSLHNEWQMLPSVDPKGKVRYRVLEMGIGEKPVLASYILMKYTGILFDSLAYSDNTGFTGPAFDSNLAPTQYYPLYNLIPAMRTVLPLLPEGTRVQMFIPSGLGYGPYDVPNPQTGAIVVPKNSNLFFDVTLQDVATQ
jgi:FKBP-type peptidyl-prolyl cis-trans isomerase